MTDNDWTQLGVRPETVAEWQSLGVDAFTASLAQADGFGPASARNQLARLHEVAERWRRARMTDADALRWHRAGFSAGEAARWSDRGVPLDEAALAAGHRMVG
jgi:hypothetical protein